MNKYKAKRINGKVVSTHRWVMEEHLGRRLIKGEVVHHIDEDKSNNEINNLLLFPTKGAHTKFHYEEKGYLIAVKNKKKLIDGKLKCFKCKGLKEIKEFLTDTKHFLGVRGICRDCYNLRRRNKKQLSGR
ncbi:hypothetical protein LCGC14_2973040 [marine sediment metagenome]|uniref:HNH nuclease domain-containing protein n=1 Tax=marine sediment metagenome TaxID=412755 RepID=A0A0F8ZGI1_9ZZZZ